MTPQLTISTAEFNRVANLCSQHSERTYDRFINSRGLHVAKKAIEDTEKADASKIVFTLAGNVRTRIRVSRKTGLRKTIRQYDVMEDSFAARIVNARRKAAGEHPLFGKDLVKAVRRMIGARVRAVAFIRSGWIYAVKTLGRAVGESSATFGAARMKGQPKGYAIPARRAINSTVTAEIGNSALLSEQARSRVAAEGLAQAMNRESREMLDHLAKKLAPALKQFSA